MYYKENMVDSDTFRDVMGRFTTGVTIVTVMEDGIPHGMTVNSFTSVSLDPSLVLICLDKEATTTEMLRRTGLFSVNILTTEQEVLARRFSESGSESSRFEETAFYVSERGTPILHDVLGHLTCFVKEIVEGGDHLIFIGEVVDLDYTDGDYRPLIFYRGNFKSLDV